MKRRLPSQDSEFQPAAKKQRVDVLDVEDLDLLRLNPVPREHAKVQSTAVTKGRIAVFKKNHEVTNDFLRGNFADLKEHTFTSEELAFAEARRCLKCADAPCSLSCPTQIDVKSFIYSITNRNYYGAAKVILSDNPNGFSCGHVCPVSKFCVGGCNLQPNPINIGGLQAFALKQFKLMYYLGGLKQTLKPGFDVSQLPPSFQTKIAFVGCGPASISCATYLARMGYQDLTIFEKNSYPGGLSASEIPQNRLPESDLLFEVRLLTDLGVKIEYGKQLGRDFTLQQLKEQNYQVVFFAVGLPTPRRIPVFEGLTPDHNFYTSKDFLPAVAEAVKPACAAACGGGNRLPTLFGHVVVLGAGDTAMDCASSALRCGAQRVTVILRRGFSGIRAVAEERDAVIRENVDFLANFTPKEVLRSQDGKITGIELHKTDVEDGRCIIDEEQSIRFKCQCIISAFGSVFQNPAVKTACGPLAFNRWGTLDVTPEMRTNIEWVFAGGDIVGNGTTVEATNDGKTAAWHIHKYVQGMTNSGYPIPDVPILPRFYTEVDEVDLSVNMAGIPFLNPFGFASAPPATSIPMIARGFQCGWAFAVTKTVVMDFDKIVNISPRIVKGTTSGFHYGPHQSSYLNIELVSEKSMEYWLTGIQQLKARYPAHRIIASIMAPFVQETWRTLARYFEAAGADALELNLSCPHGTGEKGMGLAVGQDPKPVRQICQWVTSAVNIPVFAKMTPNITDIAVIARAAREGGAVGILNTNTVSALMGLKPNGVAWPNVDGKTTYGGYSGNAIRPIVLKFLSRCHNHVGKPSDGFFQMGSGGCESSETALQMIHCGASVVQVSSAVHNMNDSIIQDFLSGLRALMWINANPRFRDWEGMSPPIKKKKRGNEDWGHRLAQFGAGLLARRELMQRSIAADGPLVEDDDVVMMTDAADIQVPSVNEIVGYSCPSIGDFFSLDPKKHVIAIVDEDLCINCGRCYQACADTAYQAIKFDPDTHLPEVDPDDCTGCALCLDACPVIGAIKLIPRPTDYHSCRGIDLGNFGQERVLRTDDDVPDW